ncbi:hypothetical protein ACFLT4_00820 [Chloroflexota bacterium]
MDTVLEVLKWVGIVIAAGFIGYFGRYLAMLIIERMHKGKPQETAAEPPGEVAASQETSLEESKLKLEKKKAKAEAKRVKKAGRK